MPTLENDVDALSTGLSESSDLRAMVHSPIYARSAQQKAVVALAGPMGLSQIMTNTLALMASKRRLFVLPQFLDALRAKIADAKGEVTADVTSAVALSDAQMGALASTLQSKVGKTVKINSAVDPALIGGLVVKVGSRMIDTSIAARLANLQNAMKEVG